MQLVAVVRTLRLQLSFNLGVGPIVNERIVGRFFIVAIGRLQLLLGVQCGHHRRNEQTERAAGQLTALTYVHIVFVLLLPLLHLHHSLYAALHH